MYHYVASIVIASISTIKFCIVKNRSAIRKLFLVDYLVPIESWYVTNILE